MTINILDLVKGRTARLFHYTNLIFNKERDCERYDNDDNDEGTEVTCESRESSGSADIRTRPPSDVNLASEYQGQLNRQN